MSNFANKIFASHKTVRRRQRNHASKFLKLSILLIALLCVAVLPSSLRNVRLRKEKDTKSILPELFDDKKTMTKKADDIPADTLENTDVKPNIKKQQPLGGWIYEPKNLQFFWKKMGDRPFQREFYSHLGKFDRIIDVGARGYNRYCKDLINSTTTEYFQIEPFPPDKLEIKNDGLIDCYMQEVKNKFPELKNSFNLVIDFGVFGWGPVQVGFNETDIKQYVDGVLFLLKERGIWALKIDKGWVANQEEFFQKYILPHFIMGDFENTYHSGHSLKKGNFVFYFFHKK